MNGATALPLARTKTPPKTPMVINTGMSQYFRRARRKPQNSVTKSSIDTFPSESQACAALQQRTLAIKVIARDAWQVRGRKSSSRAARTNCGAISFSRVRHNHAISPGGFLRGPCAAWCKSGQSPGGDPDQARNRPQPKDCAPLGFEVSPTLLVRADEMIE